MSNLDFLYLSRRDVEAVSMDISVIIDLLERVYLQKSQGKVEMPPKPGIHPKKDAFIHAMPASIPGMSSAGIKWVSGFPENSRKGLPYITGLLILNDVDTGIPYAVMDATWITAYRTGAKTAIAAKHLARPDSEVIGMLACGAQGRTNLAALATVFPVKRVYAYDIDPEAQRRYVTEMSERFDFEVVGVNEPKRAIIESDIVVTSGPILREPTPTIRKDWLKPGGFGSAVDYDSYWTSEALTQMDCIFTDDLAQFQSHRHMGYFQHIPDPSGELSELVSGRKLGRRAPEERTLAMNLGLAMDDIAVAPEIYRRAQTLGLGVRLPL